MIAEKLSFDIKFDRNIFERGEVFSGVVTGMQKNFEEKLGGLLGTGTDSIASKVGDAADAGVRENPPPLQRLHNRLNLNPYVSDSGYPQDLYRFFVKLF